MRKYIIYFIVFALIAIACKPKHEKAPRKTSTPNTFKTNGYVVPKDSVAEPKVILVNESKLKKIKAGNLKVIPANTNIRIAGISKTWIAGNPKVITPCPDTLFSPKSNNIGTSTALITHIAGIPEVVIAKDPYIKDNNPQNFSSFGKLQGLKHGYIRSMIQDLNGNLWFGTAGGVCKYDGKNFTIYSEKEGLLNNTIWSMCQDKSGNIWFGTSGGVSKFDGISFTNFTEKEGLSNNMVYSVLQDKSGVFWFGTSNGISKLNLNEAEGSIQYTFTNFTEKQVLSNKIVHSIIQEQNGNIWFGTECGAYKYDGKNFNIYTEKEGLSNNDVFSIIQDKSGNIWFSTLGGGVSKFDGKSFTNFTEKEGLSNNDVLSILQDQSGNFWFGTEGGLFRYDGTYFTNFSEKEGLSNNIVYTILQDQSGNLWFGTFGGVNKYDGKNFTNYTVKEGLSSNRAFSIIQDQSGNIWFGTDDGISKYNGKNFTNITEKEGLLNNTVFSIIQDQRGNFWFSTDGGVCKYDGKYFTNFTMREGLLNNRVWSILEDKKNVLWFGIDGGVCKYDGKSFTNFTDKEGLINNRVFSIIQDKSGNIWIGTDGGVSKLALNEAEGSIHYTFTNFTEKEGLVNNCVRSIYEDQNGNLWFGTNGGASKYDGKSFTNYTEKEGLSNNFVFSIFQDKSKNLWLGTRFGLNKLKENNEQLKIKNPEMPLFKYYTYEDGFLGIGINAGKTIYEDKNGTIWIGSNDRLTAYHPEGDIPDTIPPNIQLTSVELFNEHIPWSKLATSLPSLKEKKNIAADTSFVLGNGVRVGDFEFDGITKWYTLPENLSLAYNNNYMTFKFIGITTRFPKKVKYQYKLEGIDENWSALTNRTEAPYGNLPAGSYTFKVKAMNSEGYWSKEYNYKFTIRPPWWKTWWCRSMEIAGLLFLILAFIIWRERKLKRDKAFLERKVKEQTKELFEKNEALNKQNEEVVRQRDEIIRQHDEISLQHKDKIVQNQLLSELNATKDKFFSIIAHDLRNPFNSILGFSNALMNRTDSYEIETIKKYAFYINKSAQKTFKLLENLLEWARIQQGLIKPVFQSENLQSLVNEVCQLVINSAQHKNISIQNNVKSDIFANCDNEMTKTIFRNLLSNAIKYTNPGGNISIFASLKNTFVEIEIQDNGVGIHPETLPHLFKIDKQVSTTGTDDEQGTGLGLLLCKEFVEKQNGQIWVKSELDKGTTFYFTLPC